MKAGWCNTVEKFLQIDEEIIINNLKLYNRKIKTPAYLDLNTFFPEHKILEENWEEIKGEIDGIIASDRVVPKFHEIDKGQGYISDNDGISWNLFNIKIKTIPLLS